MADADLRAFVTRLEGLGELKRVAVAASPHLEMTALCQRALHAGGPALLFEQPTGYAMPVLGNLFGTTRRVALAMGVSDISALRQFGAALAALREEAAKERGAVMAELETADESSGKAPAQLGRLRYYQRLLSDIDAAELLLEED